MTTILKKIYIWQTFCVLAVIVFQISIPSYAWAQKTSSFDLNTIAREGRDRSFPHTRSVWPANSAGRYVIPVCWELGAMSDAFSAGRLTVQRTAEEQWAKNSNIDFVGWTLCE